MNKNNKVQSPTQPPRCKHGIAQGTACIMCSMIANNTRIAIAFVASDGSVQYLPQNMELLEAASNAWRESLTPEQLEAHKNHGTTGGAVQLKMLKEDYDKLEFWTGDDNATG